MPGYRSLYEAPGSIDLSGDRGLTDDGSRGICLPGSQPIQNQCRPTGIAPDWSIECILGSQVAYGCRTGSMA